MRPLKQILLALASIARVARRRRPRRAEDVAAVRDYVEKQPRLLAGRARRGAAPARAAARPHRRSGPLRARGRRISPRWPTTATARCCRRNGRPAIRAARSVSACSPTACSSSPRRRTCGGCSAAGCSRSTAALAASPRRLCPLSGRRAGLSRPVRHLVHGDARLARRRGPRHAIPSARRLTPGAAPARRPETVTVAARLAPIEGEAAFAGTPMLLDAAAMLAADGAPALSAGARPAASASLSRPEIDGAYVQLKATRGLDIDAFLTAALAAAPARAGRATSSSICASTSAATSTSPAISCRRCRIGDGGGSMRSPRAAPSRPPFPASAISGGGRRRLTIVGEPIGDRLEFWAEGDIVVLPGLGALMLYASRAPQLPDRLPRGGLPRLDPRPSDPGASLQPDIADAASLCRFPRRPRSGDGRRSSRDIARRRPRLAYETAPG